MSNTEDLEEIGSDVLSSGEDRNESNSDQDGEVFDSEEEDDFEDQGSSSEDDEGKDSPPEESDSEGEEGAVKFAEELRNTWSAGLQREKEIEEANRDGSLATQKTLHLDDLSSDDDGEGNTNRIGRVPLHWYDEYDHIGYDKSGTKVMRGKTKDGLDAALERDNPEFYRTIYDAYNGKEVVLSERDMEIIRRLRAGAIAHPEHESYPEYVDYNTWKKEKMPLSGQHEPKRRFLPSKWEMMKVMQIVKGIREGRISLEKKDEKKPEIFMIWKEDEDIEERKRGPIHIPAPKVPLPGHDASYRPPEEYLPTEEEIQQWEDADPEERERDFLPKKHNSLREVGAYKNFVKERFERCLDLYLCPRAMKKRLNIDPESLVPKLPRPSELKPFPNSLAMRYTGHTDRIRSLSTSPDGQFLASGSDDGTLRIWEISTGRCLNTFKLGAAVAKVVWNPNSSHDVVAALSENKVLLIVTGTANEDAMELTNALLEIAEKGSSDSSVTSKVSVKWSALTSNQPASSMQEERVGPRLKLEMSGEVQSITWHKKGDYLATVVPLAGANSVIIHQISKMQSQAPFKRSKGQVQCVAFHPSKPFLFVATQTTVRVYHLIKQMLVKKLLTGCKWISTIDIHPSGDHILIGSYDRRVVWFDLDLSSKPYRTLKYHEKAIRNVQYHRRYPLMASASDDGTVHVFHSTVYSDLLRNPLIVPLKILRGHEVTGGLGVLAMEFHPLQPWLFSGGADGSIRLFQNI